MRWWCCVRPSASPEPGAVDFDDAAVHTAAGAALAAADRAVAEKEAAEQAPVEASLSAAVTSKTPQAPPPNVNDFTLLGVSLIYLQWLLRQARERQKVKGPRSKMRQGGRRRKGEPLTTADVCFEIVRPATEAQKIAHVDLDPSMASEVGPATAFLSHAWSYDFEWLVSAVESAGLPPETRYWMDVAVVNQHANATRGFDWWSTTFREAVGKIGTTLLVLAPWRSPVPLRRAWCIWEIFCTIDTGSKLRVLLPAAELEGFLQALMKSFDALLEALTAVDVQKAQAWDPEDLRNILAAVVAGCGVHALNVAAAGGLRDGVTLAVQEAVASRWPEGEAPSKEVLVLAHNLAVFLKKQEKFEESRSWFGKVIEAKERVYGVEGESTLRAVGDLAGVLQEMKLYDEAKVMHDRAIVGLTKVYGADAEETLTTVMNLASLLDDLEQYDEAESLYLRALHGYEATLGEEHATTLRCVGNLGDLYQRQGKLQQAKPCFDRQLAGRQQVLGAEHPETMLALAQHGDLLRRMGDAAAAEPELRRAVAGLEKVLGGGHGWTQFAARRLAAARA